MSSTHESVCQADNTANPAVADVHIQAGAEAVHALAALDEDEFAGPDIAEAKRRIGNMIRLLFTGER